MADAKIISYGKDIGAGTTVIPDNQVALDIESTDAKEYISLDTSDSAPRVILAASGAKTSTGGQPPMCQDGGLHVGIGDSGLSAVGGEQDDFVIEGGDSHTGMSIVTSSSSYDCKVVFGRNGAPYAGAITYDNGSNALGLVSNGTERVTVSNAGVVSIDSTEDPITIGGSLGGKISFARAGGVAISAAHASGSLYFQTGGGVNRAHLNNVGYFGVGDLSPTSMIGIKGNLATALAGTFTATNGSAAISSGSSTAFLTELALGSAIKIGSEIFTVTAIASNTALTLDSTFAGSTASGLSGTTDPDLFQVKSGDGKVQMKLDNIGQLTLGDTATAGNILITDGDIVTATAIDNVIIGSETRTTVTTVNSVLIGKRAGRGTDVTGVTAIGSNAGESGMGVEGTTIGYHSSNVGSGNYSTAVGARALALSTDAGGGSEAQQNVAVGASAGANLTTGHDCVFIGAGANCVTPGAIGYANQIAIGRSATCDAANTAVIGNASLVLIRPGSNGNVELGNASYEWDDVFTQALQESSDRRGKEQIENTSLGLDFINRLRPVSYKHKDVSEEWETRTSAKTNEDGETVQVSEEVLIQPAISHTRKHQGLIAQEVKATLDDIGMDAADFGGYVDANISGGADKLALRYRQFIAPLIKAVQELTARIEELENGE